MKLLKSLRVTIGASGLGVGVSEGKGVEQDASGRDINMINKLAENVLRFMMKLLAISNYRSGRYFLSKFDTEDEGRSNLMIFQLPY